MRKFRLAVIFIAMAIFLVLPFQNCVDSKSQSNLLPDLPSPLDPSADELRDLEDPIQVKVSNSDQVEDGMLVVEVELSREDFENFVLTWKTIDDTALAGEHFINVNGRLVIPKGETKGQLLVPAIQTDDSDDLHFFVEIDKVSKGSITNARSEFTLRPGSAKYQFINESSTASAAGSRGRGPSFSQSTSIELDSRGRMAYVTDPDLDQIKAVNLTTGSRTISVADIPRPIAAALSRDDTTGYVISNGGPSIFRVNFSNGQKVFASTPNLGTGPNFVRPVRIELNQAEDAAYVIDLEAASLFRVDLATGDRTIVSGPGIGNGPDFLQPTDLALFNQDGFAYVADIEAKAVFVVNLANGDRTLLSDAQTGIGDEFESPANLSLTPNQKRLFVLDREKRVVFEIDLATGDRIVTVDQSVGVARDLAIHPLAISLFVIERSSRALLKFR